MANYTADQIIGKSLLAKVPVDIYRTASDSAPSVYTVPAGTSVGIVYSYLLPGPGRSTIYWQFLDNTGRSYFTSHQAGKYDVKSLQDQGALTLEEQKKLEEEKNLTGTDKIIRAGTNLILILSGAALLINYLKNK